MSLPIPPPTAPAFTIPRPKLEWSTNKDFQQTGFSVLIEGPPHSGKTHFFVTIPNALILHTDPNTSVISRARDDAKIVVVRDWQHFKNEVLPVIEAGEIDFTNGVLDTATYLSRMCEAFVGIVGDGNDGSRYTKHQIEFTTAIQRLLSTTKRTGTPGRTYNWWVGVHEQDKVDRGGAVIDIEVALVGKSRQFAPSWFDSVMLAVTKVDTTISGMPPKPVVTVRRFLSPQPIDNFRTHVSDRLGGSRFPNRLPPEVPNDYSSLMAAWGVPEVTVPAPTVPAGAPTPTIGEPTSTTPK